MRYYSKFDGQGRRTASVPDIFAADYGGSDRLVQDGYILIPDEDYQHYIGNRGAGKNGTGYVYDKTTGKPIDAPPSPPVPPKSTITTDPETLIVMKSLAAQNERLMKIEESLKK